METLERIQIIINHLYDEAEELSDIISEQDNTGDSFEYSERDILLKIAHVQLGEIIKNLEKTIRRKQKNNEDI